MIVAYYDVGSSNRSCEMSYEFVVFMPSIGCSLVAVEGKSLYSCASRAYFPLLFIVVNNDANLH